MLLTPVHWERTDFIILELRERDVENYEKMSNISRSAELHIFPLPSSQAKVPIIWLEGYAVLSIYINKVVISVC